jgi:SAM-dependent methyltransferase
MLPLFSIQSDGLNEEQMRVYAERWLLEESSGPSLSLEQVDLAFNMVTPRSIFLKNLTVGASVLDLGAGDGTLSIYKEWPLYTRADLRMYALSLEFGKYFDKYDGYELKNFEDANVSILSDVAISAIVCAHFIEHMKQPESTITLLSDRMRPGGRLYLEWPHEVSKRMPPRLSLLEKGINISTTRFDDDGTHVEAWDMGRIVSLLENNGFKLEVMGRVYFPFLAKELRDHGRQLSDPARLTLGFWSLMGWAQYLVARKDTV